MKSTHPSSAAQSDSPLPRSRDRSNIIDDATAARFRRDGVVHVQGAFIDWLDVLRAGVERNMRSPGPYTKEYEPDGSQEVHYPYLFDVLEEQGYERWVACEYRPAGDTLAGLDWARPYGIDPARAR